MACKKKVEKDFKCIFKTNNINIYLKKHKYVIGKVDLCSLVNN